MRGGKIYTWGDNTQGIMYHINYSCGSFTLRIGLKQFGKKKSETVIFNFSKLCCSLMHRLS